MWERWEEWREEKLWLGLLYKRRISFQYKKSVFYPALSMFLKFFIIERRASRTELRY